METTCKAPASGRSRVWFWLAVFFAVSFGIGTLLLAIIVFIVAWFRLDRLVLGDEDAIERPTLRIVTGYPGASPEVVEQVVTVPLETQLNGTEGVQSIRSVTLQGQSEVFLRLASAQDMDATRRLVQRRIQRALPVLPADTDPPGIDQLDPDRLPLAWVVVTSERRPLLELSVLARERLRNDLLTVPGVGEVEIVGASSGGWSIHVDPDKLRAFDVTVTDLLTALRLRLRERKQVPGKGPGDLMGLVVAERGGHAVRLRDVARIELADRPHGMARCHGLPAVALGVHKAPGFDASLLRRKLSEQFSILRPTLPGDVELTVLEGPVSPRESDWLLLDIDFPVGMRRGEAAQILVELEKRLTAIRERGSVLTLIEPETTSARCSARCFVKLLRGRIHPIERIQADAQRAVEDMPGAQITVHQVVFRGGAPARKRTFEIVVEGEAVNEVSRVTLGLCDALGKSGFVTEVQSDEVELQPDVFLTLKREEAVRRGVEARECLELLATFLGGFSVGEWEADGRKQTITVVLGDRAGQGVEALRGLTVRGAEGRAVPLAELVDVQQGVRLSALYRHDGKRGARITGNVASGRSPQEAWAKCRELASGLGLPDGGGVAPWGEFRHRLP